MARDGRAAGGPDKSGLALSILWPITRLLSANRFDEEDRVVAGMTIIISRHARRFARPRAADASPSHA